MSALPRSGGLTLDARGAAELAGIAEELADGFAALGSYQLGEPIPPESWRPVCHAASRLVIMLGERAALRARVGLVERITQELAGDDRDQEQPQTIH